ncbi:MinD/ParA family ATP-binding protein [Mycobacterium kansasii]|uniref:MinD/ParA family ATP-binding protein n=1 Tax=Mycobacterium kansasii TaxID=1768 RepID=UPI000C080B51|nr:MinD/ParA family protein [Mycobacterium kansasii]
MPADYDKLFRPAEGSEPPEEESTESYFDASSPYPPPTKPNGDTPATPIDWSQPFPPAAATSPPPSVETPPPPPKLPLPPMPIGGPPPAPPEPPPAPPEPPVPPSVRPQASAEAPAPPGPPETAPPGKPVSAAEPPAGKQPSAEPPPAPPSPKPPVAPMVTGAPPTPTPPRPEAPRRPGPPPPATTWRSPSPPAAPQPSRSATEPFAAAPKPPQPPTAPTRPLATETSPHSVRAGEQQQPQQPAPPPEQPPSDAPRHSRRARRGHRYRAEPDDDQVPAAAGAALPQHRATDKTQPASRVGPASAFAWLPQRHSDVDRPPEAAAAAAVPPTETHPEPTGGRRARRRADQAADATPTTVLTPSGLAPTRAQPPGPVRAQPPHSPAQGQPPPAPAPPRPQSEPAPVDGRRAGKPAKLVSKRGWRRWVHSITRINVGLSPDEKYELGLRNRVNRRPRGSYQIAVLGLKGGAGKTTTTVTLGTTLAQVRGDRILVLDADPGCGNLAERAGRSSPSSIADLLADPELSHYNDVRAHTSVNAANLEILPTQEYTTARRGLSGEDMRVAVDKVSKFYNLVIADCGAGLFDPVTRSVLETSSAIVIVTNVSIDSARQAAIALEWLRHNGYQDLLNRACVVVDHVSVGETNVAEKHVVRQFEQQLQPGRVVVLPWDKHIAAGGEIHLDQLGPVYKRRILELAAALSDDFERAGRR